MAKLERILISNAAGVFTSEKGNLRLYGADIYIEGPEIKKVGKNLKKQITGKFRKINAKNCVVVPGFVNTHHHLYQTFTRAIPEVANAKLFDWLIYLYEVWANLTPEAVYTSALVGLGELLLTGCTTSADQFYVFPEDQPTNLIDEEIAAAKKLGIRFHPTHGSMSLGRSRGGLPPDRVVQKEEKILQESERLVNKFHDSKKFALCRISLAPCSPFSVTRELLKLSAEFARKKQIYLHTHLAETLDEEKFCQEKMGKRPFEYMQDVGWTGNDVWYAHCVYLNNREIQEMAKTGTGVAHCPVSNLRLGSGIAPIRQMLDAGVNVGLAVDGSASNDASNMLAELRQCLLIHRIKSGVNSMPVDDVLLMATTGGANVLGRNDIGKISPGYAADIAIYDLNKIAYAGASDPIDSLLLCGSSQIARTVLVNGKIVVDNYQLQNINEKNLVKIANRLSKKILPGGKKC